MVMLSSPADAAKKAVKPKTPVKSTKKATTKTSTTKSSTTTSTTTAAPTTTVAAAPTAAPTTVPTGPAFAPTVSWSNCGAGVECGVLTTLLDSNDQASPKVQIGVARRVARASNRLGVLIVNPGGPGGSAVDMVTDTNLDKSMPSVMRDRFDVIGIDPRGTTRSLPVLCSVSPTGATDEERSKNYASACGSRSGSVLPFVSTSNSADDIEALRIALGEQQISYLGFSWGTYLGGLYAQKYPNSIRSMILDGGVDPTRFGVASREDQMKAQERSLSEFLTACEKSSAAACPLKTAGKTTKLRYEEMLLIAEQTGIGAEKINRDDLEALTGILLGLSWTALARALGDLSKGGTASTLSIFDYLNSDSSSRYEDGSYEAVACRDGFFASAHPEENISKDARAERYRKAAPHFLVFAEYWATESTCSAWTVPPRPTAALSTTAGSKIMVIGNTLDLRTPIEWSQGLASQLGAKMVTYDDYVHTAAFSGEPCITEASNNWLTALSNPPSVC